MSILPRYLEIQPCDGKHGYQVSVYTLEDLRHYEKRAAETGHLIRFDVCVPENAMGYRDPEHDVYQIFPPEFADRVCLRMPGASEAFVKEST